jgi:hypothetical protein
MHGNLAEAEEEFEGFDVGEEFVLILSKHLVVETLNAVVELFFLLGGKRQHVFVDNGNGWGTLDHGAEGIERAMQQDLGKDRVVSWLPTPERGIGNTDERQEADNVFEGVHERRS